jgi:hypothetical protein
MPYILGSMSKAPGRVLIWVLATLVVSASMTACSGSPSSDQVVGDGLVEELARVYPDQITAIAFENAPPLDPPTLFVDLAQSMTPDQQLRFICQELRPRVRAVSSSISIASGPWGWWDSDCG